MSEDVHDFSVDAQDFGVAVLERGEHIGDTSGVDSAFQSNFLTILSHFSTIARCCCGVQANVNCDFVLGIAPFEAAGGGELCKVGVIGVVGDFGFDNDGFLHCISEVDFDRTPMDMFEGSNGEPIRYYDYYRTVSVGWCMLFACIFLPFCFPFASIWFIHHRWPSTVAHLHIAIQIFVW